MSAVDAHVGARLRQRRQHLRMSLISLAREVGVEVNQLAAIEEEQVRLDPASMTRASEVLGVEVAYFFEGFMGEVEGARGPGQQNL